MIGHTLVSPRCDEPVDPGRSRVLIYTRTKGSAFDRSEEILEHAADVVVLSRGQLRALQVPEQTLAWLRERGVEAHVHGTKRAVEHYNELAGRRRVGALIHSTC